MEKHDGRKLSKTALEERRMIIRMKENGSSPSEIAAATGCSRQAIYPLWKDWKKSKTKNLSLILPTPYSPFPTKPFSGTAPTAAAHSPA
ncbi:MAG: helix-turn-helix domain-containing protein [Treponema sp.]|jgi:DNA invertase Pin-like site-specific DNA recombinase|nr:helix-turn-helix domain-containing protein [Treponema sp.]